MNCLRALAVINLPFPEGVSCWKQRHIQDEEEFEDHSASVTPSRQTVDHPVRKFGFSGTAHN